MKILICLITPFLGTALGASLVLFTKNKLSEKWSKILLGFAAGVMVAASFFSLLLPSIELSKEPKFIPAAVGFALGMSFLLILDSVIPHSHALSNEDEGMKSKWSKTTKMILALILHNIPEGISTGIVVAGYLNNNIGMTIGGAISLAIGIALQNLPEGAIISLPLRDEGCSRKKSFLCGVASGLVEPICAILTILVSKSVIGALPYILSFAAGSMMYVVVEELIPESQTGHHSNKATLSFAVGFICMIITSIIFG